MKRCVTMTLALALGLAATGCSGEGELGHGQFHYICTGEDDFSCDVFNIDDLDDAVAVGATFDLEYRRDISDPAARLPFAGIEPASDQVVERSSDPEAGGMRFLVPGEGAFLAKTSDGTVVDFVHMFAEEVVDIDISGPDVFSSSMGMQQGQTTRLTAYPLGLGGEHLMGSMTCVWTTDDATIVTMDEGDSCSVQIDAMDAGEATLTVRMNDDVERELAITVEGTL